MFAGKPGAYLSEAPSSVPLLGRLLTLTTTIRLGLECLPGTNTPACYENLKITDKKSFITLAPGVNLIKQFTFVTDK
jgi:hypothetical protein